MELGTRQPKTEALKFTVILFFIKPIFGEEGKT